MISPVGINSFTPPLYTPPPDVDNTHFEADGALKADSPLHQWTPPPITPFDFDLTFSLLGQKLSLIRLIEAYPGEVCLAGSALPLDRAWAEAAEKTLPIKVMEAFNAGIKRARDLDLVFIPAQEMSLGKTLCTLLNVDLKKLKSVLIEYATCTEFTLFGLYHPEMPVDLIEARSLPHLTSSESLFVTYQEPTKLRSASGSVNEALLHRIFRIAHYPRYKTDPWRHLSGGFKRFIQLQTQGWSAPQEGIIPKLIADAFAGRTKEQVIQELSKRLSHLPETKGADFAFACNLLFRLREQGKREADEIAEALFNRLPRPQEALFSLRGAPLEQVLQLLAFFGEKRLMQRIVLPKREELSIPKEFEYALRLTFPLLAAKTPKQESRLAEELLTSALIDAESELSSALVALLCFKMLHTPRQGLIPALGKLLPHLPPKLKELLIKEIQDAFRWENSVLSAPDVDFFLELFNLPNADRAALARTLLRRLPLPGDREKLKEALRQLDLAPLLDETLSDEALLLLFEMDPMLEIPLRESLIPKILPQLTPKMLQRSPSVSVELLAEIAKLPLFKEVWPALARPEKELGALITHELLEPVLTYLEKEHDPFIATADLVPWNRLLAKALHHPKAHEAIIGRVASLFLRAVRYEEISSRKEKLRSLWRFEFLQEIEGDAVKEQFKKYLAITLRIRSAQLKSQQKKKMQRMAALLYLKLQRPDLPEREFFEKKLQEFAPELDEALKGEPGWKLLCPKIEEVPVHLTREQLELIVPLFMVALTLVGYFLKIALSKSRDA